jgi:His-Xaa-Ser system protein HxsD
MTQEIKKIIDLKVYPLEAVYGAAYLFVDRVYIFLDTQEKDKLEVSLRAKEEVDFSPEKIEGEFMNELLNYTLRLKLSDSNKKIREQIVEQALFAALGREEGILKNNDQEQKFEFEDDPLGIAIPWEDKYGKDKKDES